MQLKTHCNCRREAETHPRLLKVKARMRRDCRKIAFCPRDAMRARSLRQRRVRPSVRPSHAGIVRSRAKAGSRNVHRLIAP